MARLDKRKGGRRIDASKDIPDYVTHALMIGSDKNRVSHIMLEIFGFNAFSMSRKNHV